MLYLRSYNNKNYQELSAFPFFQVALPRSYYDRYSAYILAGLIKRQLKFSV